MHVRPGNIMEFVLYPAVTLRAVVEHEAVFCCLEVEKARVHQTEDRVPAFGRSHYQVSPSDRAAAAAAAALPSSAASLRPELGIELSLNSSKLVVGTVVWLRT